ncbi:glycerol-3-phosphate dehydrogenase [Rhexocercosporidium sp. MPI-PUGE-AT-0058]|nr:glycerol-3-phosphate dehydrogenase [Rhexocercosporidium sp. MPI-PUGE-AT-0058]
MHASSRLLRPLAYATVAIATGGMALYTLSQNDDDLRSRFHKPVINKSGKVVPPTFPRVKSRREQKSSSSDDSIYDLLIIGGGATGTGIALDTVTRGLKVTLIERDDFSSGTSSKSTKLIHGGQFKLVQEALRERKHFSNVAPHLASWLPVMLPLQSWLKAPYFWTGTKYYDLLAGSKGFRGSYFLTKAAALEAFPLQKNDELVGAPVYYDGQHNDSRMNISLAMTASLYGATIVNHVEATELPKDSNGKICGAWVRDVLPNISAYNETSDEFDKPKDGGIVVPSTGVHIVLPAYFSSKIMGLINPSTSDGHNDVDWILNEIRGYLAPGVSLQRSDVLTAWSGIRPLVQDPKAANTTSLVRNHLVTVSESGLLTCAGGKWTTYRQMAEDTVDKAIEVFQLQHGESNIEFVTHGFHDTLAINLIQHYSLDEDIASHFVRSYVDRAWEVANLTSKVGRLVPDHYFVDREIIYAMKSEAAETAVDVLARRMKLAFIDVQSVLQLLPRVIDMMGEELKWDQRRLKSEWTDSVEFLKSMGLPQNKFGISREEKAKGSPKVESRHRDFRRHMSPDYGYYFTR